MYRVSQVLSLPFTGVNLAKVLLALSLAAFMTSSVQAAVSGSNLEDPPQGTTSLVSGIGLIRGWVCGAQIVEIQFNDALPFRVPYGSPRKDVVDAGACADINSGFAIQENWNIFGPRTLQVTLLADGQVLRTAMVTVTTLGLPEEFATGLSGSGVIQNFPKSGQTTNVTWQQSLQNFVITNVSGGSGTASSAITQGALDSDMALLNLQELDVQELNLQETPSETVVQPETVVQAAVSGSNLEDPPQGTTSLVSGIGLIRGWVCGAQIVEIQFNDALPFRVPYGSPRKDVVDAGACADINSGFAIQENWNIFGPRTLQVTLLADGQVLRTAMVTVTTLGLPEEFATGLSGSGVIQNFPKSGQTTNVTWQQSLQNFVITNVSGGGGGEALLVDPDHLFFDIVPANQSKDLFFAAINSGTGPLSVTAMTLMVDRSLPPELQSAYSALPPTSFGLAAGMSQNVVVRFQSPSQSGSGGDTMTTGVGARLDVNSTGGTRSVDLSANFRDILAPVAQFVSSSSLQFNSVPVGMTAQQFLTLTNGGLYATLRFTLSTLPPFGLNGGGFIVSQGFINVPPGEARRVGVIFRPTSSGFVTGDLFVTIDSDNEDTTDVTLSGTGGGEPQ